MRKIILWIVAALVGLGAGCTVPGVTRDAAEAPIPAGKGQLVVRWAGELGKSLLGSSWAASVADAYELVLVGAGGTKAFTLGAGSGQAVAVDPGTYRVLVLAGVKRSSGSATAYLVGSALADGVTVVVGQRSPLDLVLKSVDLGWEASGPAYWKGTVTVRATGASRNPALGMSLAGTSTTQRPRFKNTDVWGGYKETTVAGTPDAWTADAVATVPGSGTSFVVELVGAGLVVAGTDGAWSPLAGVTSFTWAWPNRPEVADTHPLAPFTAYTVPTSAPPTGVDVNLGWE
jgi:hypothetical protein